MSSGIKATLEDLWTILPDICPHIHPKWILSSIEGTVSWARMMFKPRSPDIWLQGRGMSLWNARIQDNQIKFGKWFDVTMKDKEVIAGL